MFGSDEFPTLKSRFYFPVLVKPFLLALSTSAKLALVLAFSSLLSFVMIPPSLPQTFAQNSNFNMSDLAANSTSDLTELLASFKPVNGSYSNPDQGFEITFPQGWEGTEILVPFGKIVSVSPLAEALNATDMSKFSAMSIVFVDNRNNTALSAISELSNPANNATATQNAKYTEAEDCGSLVFSPVILDGIKGEQVTYSCEDIPMGAGSNTTAKTKGITLATNDDSLIFVSFSASPNVYDLDIPKFEQSLKTVKISNPGDILDSHTYQEYKKLLDKNIAK
jgi:hypothetical protein